MEKAIKKEKELFYAIEGIKTISIIVQKQSVNVINSKFRTSIIEKKEGLSLVTLFSQGIDDVPGAVHYITGLFFENGINIYEFMSCYDDTLVVVKTDQLNNVMRFLDF